MPLLLSEVVETSAKVRAVRGRLAKIGMLAELLARARPEEVGIVVAWLSGVARQGRIGVGHATLRDAAGPPAETATLTVGMSTRGSTP